VREGAVAEVTVGATLRAAGARLAAVSQTPRLDAELLLAETLGWRRERLLLDRDTLIDEHAARRFEALLARRGEREPVAYLLGRRGFRHLTLAVDPRVLIPRPETELLVETALDLAEGATVLDVGTGSGAVALALKHERPDLQITATDVSGAAVEVARANAASLDLDVSFRIADLLSGVGRLPDAVLANLPYVPDETALMADVEAYEPVSALRGGTDGLAVIRRLLGDIGSRAPVERPGWIGLEIGSDQGAAVAALVTAAGYRDVAVRRDLAGLDRVVVGAAGE
jgi:release factor glutamine methyltransferase